MKIMIKICLPDGRELTEEVYRIGLVSYLKMSQEDPQDEYPSSITVNGEQMFLTSRGWDGEELVMVEYTGRRTKLYIVKLAEFMDFKRSQN